MAGTDGWDPAQYERFKAERAAPFHDLVALVEPRPRMRVVDLGCGTGTPTRALHDRLGASETVGVDRSAAMLARSAAVAVPGLRFVQADVADFAPDGPVDLVFSNAALHWVPRHDDLFARLAGFLAPGGQLAVQMPTNFDHPSHTTVAALATEAPFRDALAGWSRDVPVATPEHYALLLDRLGFRAQHVRLQVYLHRLASRDDVVEWVRGTLLVDYAERLPADLFACFLERYRERLRVALPDLRPFPYTYKRLLMWAAR